jgi:ribose 5-phosphate isomerase B
MNQPRAIRAERESRASAGPPLRVALGADHGGFALKQQLVRHVAELGYDVEDTGTHDESPVDYPDIAVEVAQRVASGRCARGIVIDAAGLGSCMAANKVGGVRAATCHDEVTTRNSREHNDANVLVLGARVVHPGEARRLVRIWLATPFAGGRHARRVEKIDALDGARTAVKPRET